MFFLLCPVFMGYRVGYPIVDGEDKTSESQITGAGSPQSDKKIIPVRLHCWGKESEPTINLYLQKIFQRTNILEKNNLRGEFVESIKDVKEIDILFEGVLKSFDQGFKGKIIANLGAFSRYVLAVPPDSPIKTLPEIKGKTIGIQDVFLPTDYYLLLNALYKVKLKPEQDVKIIHSVKSLEPPDVRWCSDLSSESFVRLQNYRIIFEKKQNLLVSISDELRLHQPEAVRSFINALKEALFFLATHKEDVIYWLAEDLEPLTTEDLTLPKITQLTKYICELNRNYNVKTISEINIEVAPDDIRELKQRAAYLLKIGKIKRQPDFDSIMAEAKFSDEVKRKISDKTYDPTSVKILVPDRVKDTSGKLKFE